MRNRVPILLTGLICLAAGYFLEQPADVRSGRHHVNRGGAERERRSGHLRRATKSSRAGRRSSRPFPGTGLDVRRRPERVCREPRPRLRRAARRAAGDPASDDQEAVGPRPEHRVPDRPAAVAGCDHRQPSGQRRQRAAGRGRHGGVGRANNKMGVDARWEHCILVFDGQGNLLPETANWMQWDASLQRPHFIAISPYDADKNVWLIDDHKHVIYKFTHDGKTKLLTHRHLRRAGRGRHALQPADLHGLVPRRQLRRRRRLQRHARREVRQEREVPDRRGARRARTRTTRGRATSTTCTASPSIRRRGACSSTIAATTARRSSTRTASSSTSGGSATRRRTCTCSTSRATATCGPPTAARTGSSSTTSTATSCIRGARGAISRAACGACTA